MHLLQASERTDRETDAGCYVETPVVAVTNNMLLSVRVETVVGVNNAVETLDVACMLVEEDISAL